MASFSSFEADRWFEAALINLADQLLAREVGPTDMFFGDHSQNFDQYHQGPVRYGAIGSERLGFQTVKSQGANGWERSDRPQYVRWSTGQDDPVGYFQAEPVQFGATRSEWLGHFPTQTTGQDYPIGVWNPITELAPSQIGTLGSPSSRGTYGSADASSAFSFDLSSYHGTPFADRDPSFNTDQAQAPPVTEKVHRPSSGSASGSIESGYESGDNNLAASSAQTLSPNVVVESSDEKEKDIETLLLNDLLAIREQEKKPVPPGYICHRCGIPGHYVTDCRKNYDGVEFTTYQGGKECVGEFQCKECKRKWVSQHSFRNQYEKCKNCKTYCLPKKQFAWNVAEAKGLFKKYAPKKQQAWQPTSVWVAA